MATLHMRSKKRITRESRLWEDCTAYESSKKRKISCTLTSFFFKLKEFLFSPNGLKKCFSNVRGMFLKTRSRARSSSWGVLEGKDLNKHHFWLLRLKPDKWTYCRMRKLFFLKAFSSLISLFLLFPSWYFYITLVFTRHCGLNCCCF